MSFKKNMRGKSYRYWAKPLEEPAEFVPTASSSRGLSGVRSDDKRPPSGLRGRELGLWYRDRSKRAKQEGGTNAIPLLIPFEREQRIQNLLASIKSNNSNRLNYDLSKGFENDQPESNYPKEYVDMVKLSFFEKMQENIVTLSGKLKDDMEINRRLRDEYNNLQQNKQYLEMLKFRKKLPTYKMKSEILNLVNNNQVVVLSGETGCGKSTQVPQLILEEACKDCYGSQINICVMQPRRIAAIALANRVASERGENIGHSIGYAIRLEAVHSRYNGSITYMTTGVLLRELEIAPALLNYSHVILDEVHERDVNTDLTLITLKRVIKIRSDLKIILMSATLDAEKLTAYFNDCPSIHVPGLAFPVEDFYLEDVLQVTKFIPSAPKMPTGRGRYMKFFKNKTKQDQMHRIEIGPYLQTIGAKYDPKVIEALKQQECEDINYDMIVELMRYIVTRGEGAILIFLPGLGEISKMLKTMETSGSFPPERYDIYPLHSKLPTLDQARIFQPPPRGIRKVVVATNIAETSITIDDVVYVIDCGKVKMTGYNPDDGIASLKPEWVSESNLRQRRGRAGRVQSGECWHLLSGFRRTKLLPTQLPELCRSSLVESVLAIKRLRLGKAQEVMAEAPDPPDLRTVQQALKELTTIGALDSQEGLTPLGWHLARLPLTPRGGKLLILGALFSCLDPIASVAACWGFKDPFVCPIGKEKEAAKAKILLSNGEPSDHFTMHQAIKPWEEAAEQEPMMANHFVYKHYLSKGTLYMLRDMRRQFAGNLTDMGFIARSRTDIPEVNVNSDNRSLFKALVAASLYPNVASVRLKVKQRRSQIGVRLPEGRVAVHPSSILGSDMAIPECVGTAHYLVYSLLQRTTNLFLFDVTAVHALPLVFFCNDIVVKPDGPDHCILSAISLENDRYYLNWRATRQTTSLISQLRKELHCLLARHVLKPEPLNPQSDDAIVLKALIELITAEDDHNAYQTQDMEDEDFQDYTDD